MHLPELDLHGIYKQASKEGYANVLKQSRDTGDAPVQVVNAGISAHLKHTASAHWTYNMIGGTSVWIKCESSPPALYVCFGFEENQYIAPHIAKFILK